MEIGDWQRLTGHSIGAYLGLVPTESSPGDTRSQGGLTKTGNSHARRLLVEAAWHHRPRYDPTSPVLRRRWDAAPPEARERAQAGNHRLHQRWVRFDQRSKRSGIANAAIARELRAGCWSLAPLQRPGLQRPPRRQGLRLEQQQVVTPDSATYFKAALGVKTVGVVFYDQAGSRRGGEIVGLGYAKIGIRVNKYPVNLGLPNFSITVAQMQADGVDLVGDAIDSNGNARLCSAMESTRRDPATGWDLAGHDGTCGHAAAHAAR